MNELIGFEKEFEIVSKNLIDEKLNNSILVCGNKGIGKYFFITNIIGDYINLKINPKQINHHLSLLNNNSHPNIKILRKKIDEKTNKIKNNIVIDQVRELNNFSRETNIIENLPKFILIDSADDLNLSSSNALLKILEEPKDNTYFFLISHQPSALLPTIKSRCLKINLSSHNFDNFKKILISQNVDPDDDEIFKLLFDITNGSPGLSLNFNIDIILDIFDQLINSIIQKETFSEINNNITNLFSNFENDKYKIFLSLIKFILIVFKKVKIGLDIEESYLSHKILKIENLSKKITIETIHNKLDYLINNENDLFTFNLDKKIFMINFFAIK
jgi:DNA polymerase-3 subunit delta'